MRFLLILIVLLAPIDSASQTDLASQKVDEVFKAYASAHSPGCSVGIIRDNDFVFRKSYGEASLELAVPLTTESVFYMALSIEAVHGRQCRAGCGPRLSGA